MAGVHLQEGFMYYFQIFSILISLVLFGIVIDFIRRGLLKEKYSVLWIASTLVITLLSLKKQLLDNIAVSLGIAYPPSLLFFVAFIFILLIILHFSVVISILHEKNKTMAQELTLLKDALKDARLNAPLSGGKKEDGKNI